MHTFYTYLIYIQLYAINYVFRFKVIIYMHIEEQHVYFYTVQCNLKKKNLF